MRDYRKKHWEGMFDEYLDIAVEHPEVCRTAYQRLYVMMLPQGTEVDYENKEKITRYKFFTAKVTSARSRKLLAPPGAK